MKLVMILILIFFTIITYSEDFPIMLNVKSDVKIPSDFRDGVEESLTKMGYSLVDDKAQKEALKENSKARNSECYDDECLVDTGKMLAARALISVEVDKKGGTAYKFKGKYIDFETGTTTKTKVMYYEAKLDDYKALSKFGKDFSTSLVGGKLEVTTKKEIENPKDVKKENHKVIADKKESKIIEKKPKEEVKKELLLLKNKRYSGDWDITISLSGGSHEFYTSYNDEQLVLEREYKGVLKGGGLGIGVTYRFNNWLGFYGGLNVLNTQGSFDRKIVKINNNFITNDNFEATSKSLTIGTQFSFGDTEGRSLVYYAKTGLTFGSDDYVYNGLDSGVIIDTGVAVNFIGVSIELGVNISIFYNNNIDIYLQSCYGSSIGGGRDKFTITDSNGNAIKDSDGNDKFNIFNNGETFNLILGIRYNLFTF